MTDKEMAEEYAKGLCKTCTLDTCRNNMLHTCAIKEYIKQAHLAGLKAGRKWHKIFKGDPMCVEYWDLPQDNLPKVENFYFVKLKNGFIKICELKYDTFSKRKYFYNLHGYKQSNVAEWLDYPKS